MTLLNPRKEGSKKWYRTLAGFTLVMTISAGLYLLNLKTSPSTGELPFNVLWLTAESTRARQLEPYGYGLMTSPNIKNFAATGTLFKQAYNPSGWTSENMVSNLTGVNSLVHKVHSRDQTTPPVWYTALEQLADLGMNVGSVQAFHKIPNYQNIGLREEDESNLFTWLEDHRDQRFFVWYHMLQAHLPYTPAEKHRKLFWKKEFIPNLETHARVAQVMSEVTVVRGEAHFNVTEDRPAIEALYNADVHAMDEDFGKILGKLKELGLRENTLVILTADHGEEILDHGFVGHASTAKGGTLYDEILHVPLILSLPGVIPEGLVIDHQVRGLDIMPSVFELLGIKPPTYFEGESLLPMIRGDLSAQGSRTAFASSSYRGYQEKDPLNVKDFMRSVRTPEWKLFYRLWDLKTEEFFLYDLVQDPGEHTDVSEKYPEKLQEMKQLLSGWVENSKLRSVTLESSKPVADRSLLQKILGFEQSPKGQVSDAIVQSTLSPPTILQPLEGAVLSYDSIGGLLSLNWEGHDQVPYLVEVQAGESKSVVEFTLNTIGPSVSRKISRDYWQDYITIYKQAKFRVRIDRPEHDWSEWRHVELK